MLVAGSVGSRTVRVDTAENTEFNHAGPFNIYATAVHNCCPISLPDAHGVLPHMTHQNQLIVFARAPQYGAVKQRLASDIGKSAAFTFYRQTLQRLLVKMSNSPHWELTIAVATKEATTHPLFQGFDVITQPDGDLGVRMLTVLDQFKDRHRIIIGSDIPHINPIYIEHAFSELAQHSVVFGPAVDGGFWLVGCQADCAAHQKQEYDTRPGTEQTATQSSLKPDSLKPDSLKPGPLKPDSLRQSSASKSSFRKGFMQRVRWSTEHALADTVATLPVNCTYTTVKTLADVDDGASYQAFLQHPDSQKDLHCYPSYRCNSVTVR